MKKYEVFPEIYDIYNQIIIDKQNIKKNKKEIKDAKVKLTEKKQKHKEIRSQFKKIEQEKVKNLVDEFNQVLLSAKYQKLDINKLYEEHNKQVAELKESYKDKIEQRIEKSQLELNGIIQTVESLKSTNKFLKEKRKEDKIRFKNAWNEAKTFRDERENQLNTELVALKAEVQKNIEYLKNERSLKRKEIIDTWIVKNPEINNYKSILAKQSRKKLKAFENDEEYKVYDLTLELNQNQVIFKNKISVEKQKLKNKKLEIKYNKGKAEPISFQLVVDKITYGSGKLANWKFMAALRNGFFALIPLVIVGAVFILINNIILSAANGGLFNLFNLTVDQLAFLDKLKTIGGNVWNGTLAFFAFMLCATIAYNLAPYYKLNPLNTSIVAMSSFLIMNPTFWGDLSVFGSTGMFTAILVSMTSTVLYGHISKNPKLKIKMPDSVPDGVAKSFNVLIPLGFVLTIFGLISFGIAEFGALIGEIQVGKTTTTFSTINELIVVIIQKPLVNVISGFGGMVVIVILWQVLWFMGIHASGIISPILEPIQLDGLAQNQQAIALGQNPEYVFTNPFMNNFIHMGGTGGTLALVLAILLFSKRSDWKSMGKITLIPALFCVNEPLLFGLPLVLNPILFIPFVIGPLLAGMFAYFATVTGIMEYSTVIVPWTTPPILGGFLTTKDVWGGVVAAINLCILFAVYSPFVLLGNMAEKSEAIKKFKDTINFGQDPQVTIQPNISGV